MAKKDLFKAKIAGIGLNSTTEEGVLRKIRQRIASGKKTFLVTPNSEFIVFAQKNPWFRAILNQADLAVPDGVGLVWAGRLLGRPIRARISGADLAKELLKLAQENRWRVGVIGARRGEKIERGELIKRLQAEYPTAQIFSLEETPNWQERKWQLIFACQGMGEQERWLRDNLDQTNALVFIGVGGALDFLTGFVPRAPKWIRKVGLEWLYRLFRQPWRWRRQLRLIEFIWLVIKERLKQG